MPAKWTGELIGEMHVNGITAKQLAEAAGLNPKYLSTVLNGRVPEPKRAEENLRAALKALLDSSAERGQQ